MSNLIKIHPEVKEIETKFKESSGIYLLLCGQLNESLYVFKPGVAQANWNKFMSEQVMNDYVRILKQHFDIVKLTRCKSNKIMNINKALDSRNGKITDCTSNVFSFHESKEFYLPIILRFKTSPFKAIFIETLINCINKSIRDMVLRNMTGLNMKNNELLFYNGYTFKGVFPLSSGNESEAVLAYSNYVSAFNNLMNELGCVKINEVDYQSINEPKLRIYNSFYSKYFKPMDLNELNNQFHSLRMMTTFNFNLIPLQPLSRGIIFLTIQPDVRQFFIDWYNNNIKDLLTMNENVVRFKKNKQVHELYLNDYKDLTLTETDMNIYNQMKNDKVISKTKWMSSMQKQSTLLKLLSKHIIEIENEKIKYSTECASI